MTLEDVVLAGAWFTQDVLNFDNLPDSVEIRGELATRMVVCTLAKAPSVQGDVGDVWVKRPTEYGGNIAWLGDLAKLQLGMIQQGSEDEVNHIWPGGSIIDAEHNRFAVGTFHTHPYTNSNATAGFSPEDIACMLSNKDEVISLVQSFTTLYLLVRTQQTNPAQSKLITSQFLNYLGRAMESIKEENPNWQINPTLNVFTEGMTHTIAASSNVCRLGFYKGMNPPPGGDVSLRRVYS